MSYANLNELNKSAILADHVYRRPITDGEVSLTNIGLVQFQLDETINELNDVFNFNDGFAYSGRGFVGEIVQDGVGPNEKYYVVFRGTDSNEAFTTGFTKALGGLRDQFAEDESRNSDIGDFVNNVNLGKGRHHNTQLDDAMALARYALNQLAGGDPSKIVVVGQSLGGGLAGVVSALLDVKGYAFAPAPFQKTLNVYGLAGSEERVLRNGGMSETDIQHLKDILFFENSASYQATALHNLGFSQTQVDLFFSMRDSEQADTALANTLSLQRNLSIHTIQGEVLSDGIGHLGNVLGFSQAFSATRTSYDIGEPGGTATSLNTAITLHGSALHALVIRTADPSQTSSKNQSFAELLKNDGALRYAMLEFPDIAAPMNPTAARRVDPDDHALYGGSGINATGASVTALFRALWKTAGVTAGLYDEFYKRFGAGLANGAVAEGKDATNKAYHGVHSGFVKLGLQVVRDGLDTQNETAIADAKALNVFGNDQISKGYVAIDLNDISNSGQNPYGSGDLNMAFFEKLSDVIGVTNTETFFSSTKFEFQNGVNTLPWEIAIANSQGSTRYIAEGVNAGKGHIVFGGAYSDFIQASTGKDFIFAGAGDDIISMTGGSDVVIGGSGSDTVSYHASPVGVNVSLMTATNLFTIENLHGTDFDDTFEGNSGDNVLIGGKGDDTFKGRGGNDVIKGGEGNDKVIFDYAFSQMAVNEFYTGIETVFSFSPLTSSGWSQRITQVEQFVDSANTVWSLADVRQAVQLGNGPLSATMNFLQSSAPEESPAGTVFGIVEVDLSSLPFASNERPGSFVIGSDTLDWTISGNVITFTLKAGIDTDLDRSMAFSTPILSASIGIKKEIYNQSTGLWNEAPGFSIGTAKFRIDDVYDDGLSEIVVGVPFHTQTQQIDHILERTPVLTDWDVNDLRMEINPQDFMGYGYPGSGRTDMIRVTANSFDRDDIVSARLTNDSDGYFRLVKFQNEELAGGLAIYKRPVWGIVMAKEGLTALSAPRTVTVEMTDGVTTLTKNVVVQLGNINEKPTDILFAPTAGAAIGEPSSTLLIRYGGYLPETALAVKEMPVGQGIVKLSAVDPDEGLDSHSYSFVSAPPINAFSIVGDEIVLNRNLTAAEKETIYTLTIEAKDSGNLTVRKTLQIVVDVPDNGLIGTSGDDTTVATAPGQSVVGREGKDTHSYLNAPGPVAVNLGTMQGNSGWAAGASYHSIEKIVGSSFPDQFRAPSSPMGIWEVDGGDGQDTLDFGSLTHGITVNLASGSVSYSGKTLVFTSIESVSGTMFADQLYGISGMSNFLSGGAGNDTLYAGADGDFVFGGDGIDTVSYQFATGPMTINLAAGSAKLTNGTLTDLLLSIENVNGSSFDDLIVAGPGPNVLQGGFGNDVYDQVDIGDTVIEVVLPPGFPVPPGWIPGIDTIRTIATSWTLGAGIENLTGLNTGNSTLKGNELDNVIIGNAGNDALYGYAGNDSLYGGGGTDFLFGGDGDDLLDGGAGNDILDGGNGSDTVSYLTRGSVTVNLATGSATLAGETDYLYSIENVIGSAFADTLIGSSDANRIRSGGGDDVIDAGAGDDVVVIDGGNVQVTLGAGDDIVVLTRGTAVTAHHVTIADFVTGEDKIHLDDGDFLPTVPYLFQDDGNGNARLEIEDYGTVTFLGRTAASMSAGDLILV